MDNSKTEPKDAKTAEGTADHHSDIKSKLVHFFKSSGHVAAHGAEALAEGALQIALAGKFGQ